MAGKLSSEEEVARASRLFDDDWYAARYPDVCGLPNRLQHFLTWGASEGRNPNPAFDTRFYARAHMASGDGRNPLVHYIMEGASRDAATHPLFDRRWYARKYLDDEGCPLRTLAHYVTVGRHLLLWPNPWLDPLYYLTSDPFLIQAGVDPLSHYHEHGDREGRPPSVHFDRTLLLLRLPEPLRREAEDGALAFALGSERRWGYLEQLAYDPSEAVEFRSKISKLLDPGLATVAFVSHGIGGGVARLVDERRRALLGRLNSILLTGHRGGVRLEVGGPDRTLAICFGTHHLTSLPGFLSALAVQSFEIHHILDFAGLQSLVSETGVAFDLFLHDYFLLSPSPHLVGKDGRFVGDDLDAHEQTLLAASIGPRPISLRAWRRQHAWLLRNARRLVAPSEDVRRRFLRRHLDLVIAVASPEGTTVRGPPPLVQQSDRIHVGILGRLSLHKGLDVLRRTAGEALGRHLPVDFTLIGSSEDDEALAQAGVAVTGAYSDAELDYLIAGAHLDVLWFPAQSPETYSYTLSAGLRSGLPLVVSNLGALPERIAGLDGCRAVDWQASPAGWLEVLMQPVGTVRIAEG